MDTAFYIRWITMPFIVVGLFWLSEKYSKPTTSIDGALHFHGGILFRLLFVFVGPTACYGGVQLLIAHQWILACMLFTLGVSALIYYPPTITISRQTISISRWWGLRKWSYPLAEIDYLADMRKTAQKIEIVPKSDGKPKIIFGCFNSGGDELIAVAKQYGIRTF